MKKEENVNVQVVWRIPMISKAIVIFVLLITNSILLAQNKFKINDIPSDQKKIILFMKSVKEKKLELEKIENPIAKQEAGEKAEKKLHDEFNGINEKLAKEGAKNWMGVVRILSDQSVHVDLKLEDTPFCAEFAFIIDKRELPPEVFNVVKQIKEGDKLRFTVGPELKDRGISFCLNISDGVIQGEVRSEIIKKIEILK